MKTISWIRALRAAAACLGLVIATGAHAQTVFVNILSSNAAPTTQSISAPAGYAYSGPAPVAGTSWNTVGKSTTIPQNTTPGSDFTLYNALSLVEASGLATTAKLTVAYHSTVTTGTRTEPSTGNGENVIQPGGVMQNAWRNYYNASGNYYTFTFTGLKTSGTYDLYFMGGTAGSGQGAGVTLAASNQYQSQALSASTANNVQNSNAVYGSLFTSNGSGGYQLMAQGTTWNLLHAQASASGELSFMLNGTGSAAYLNGFQLVDVTPVPEPSTYAALLGLCGLGAAICRKRRRRA